MTIAAEALAGDMIYPDGAFVLPRLPDEAEMMPAQPELSEVTSTEIEQYRNMIDWKSGVVAALQTRTPPGEKRYAGSVLLEAQTELAEAQRLCSQAEYYTRLMQRLFAASR